MLSVVIRKSLEEIAIVLAVLFVRSLFAGDESRQQ